MMRALVSKRWMTSIKPHPSSSKRFEEWLDKVAHHLEKEDEDEGNEGRQEKALTRDAEEKIDEVRDMGKVFVKEGVYYVDQKNIREEFQRRKQNPSENASILHAKTNYEKPISFGFDIMLDKEKKTSDDPVAIHSSSKAFLEKLMIQTIKANGPMSIRDFMKMALADPHHGYYTTKSNVFGSEGDFITSPEISPAFGEMICLWLISSWKALGSPDCFSITELGPGKGTLMQAVVQAAALDPVFLKSAKFHFIETSSHLKSIQKEKLASVISDVDQKCVWHDSLHTLPDNIPTLFIAHEFFDALPIYQFCYKDDIGWSEIVVDWSSKDDKFFLGLKKTTATALFAPSSHNTRQYERVHDEEGNIENVVNLIHFPTDPKDGEIFEVCPEGLSVAQELGERISRSRGALLMIDYGSESFSGSSLRGIRDHKFVDFFETPGLIDITADVDFSAYGRAFKSLTKTNDQGGVTVHPLIAQSQFLLGMGMHLRFDKLIRSASTKEQKFALFDTLERLVGTKPESMGQVYKVLMVSDRSLQCLNDSPILISKQSQ